MVAPSAEDFQQLVQRINAENANVTSRLDQLQQSIVEIRGQIGIGGVEIDKRFTQLADALATRTALMETSGNQIISDVQVANNNVQALTKNLQEILSNADSNFLQRSNTMDTKLAEFESEIGKKFAELDQVQADTKKKHEELLLQTRQAYDNLQKQLTELRASASGDALVGSSQLEQARRKGFMPLKSIIPKKMGDKVEDWREWKEDTADFFDTQLEGIGKFLLDVVAKHEGTIDELDQTVRDFVGKNQQKFTQEDSVMVWRALKRITEGLSLKLVVNTRDENGFAAWHNLCKFFEPRLALQQGAALQELTKMILTRARNPEETRRMMVTYQSKVKDAEDLNNPLQMEFRKSVLAGFIDETTRVGTWECQGKNKSAEEFEMKILEFVNGVAAPMSTTNISTSAPMQIGAFGGQPTPGAVEQNDARESEAWPSLTGDSWDGRDDESYELSALRKGKGKGKKGVCHGCGSPDHFVANCPVAKGKGKKGDKTGFIPYGRMGAAPYQPSGKGPGYSKGAWNIKGKGSGKTGPRDGCWKCGGPHYSDQCPLNSSGAGTGGQGGQIRHLAALVEVEADSDVVGITIPVVEGDTDVSATATATTNTTTMKATTPSTPTSHSTSTRSMDSSSKARWREEAFKRYEKSENIMDAIDVERLVQHAVRQCPCGCQLDEAQREGSDTDGYTVVVNKKKSRNQRRKEAEQVQRGQANYRGQGQPIRTPKEDETKVAPVTLPKDMQKQVRPKGRWGRLNLLIGHEPEGFNAVQATEEWELITLYVDSGATETVISEQMLSMLDLKESPQSRRGVEYEVANGKRIPNLGQKQFIGHTEDGTKRAMTAQVCEVNKALLSVSKVVGKGNKVVFGEEDANGNTINYIEDNTTKERLWMEEENGMFALKIWVRSDGKEEDSSF